MTLASEFDEPVSRKSKDQMSVISAVQQYRAQAEEAKRKRMDKNRVNRDAFLSRQDWSHKQAGQSQEFLPKVAVSVEQMSSFVKKSLVQFGDWFSVELDRSMYGKITGHQVSAIMRPFLDNLWAGNNRTQSVSTVISDAVKNGLLESLIILKVHGGMQTCRRFKVEQGPLELEEDGSVKKTEDTLEMEDYEEWRLRVDIVRPEDYYPDPTGNGLFEIQRCERDLHEVVKMAKDGIYDKAAVDELIETDFSRATDEDRRPEAQNQEETTNPQFRKRVIIDEFWGTILNEDGTIAHRNVVCTIANDKYLIRPPEPNPFWHQESPFIAEPLIRVPWSVWHKALYDDASSLNLAINEMFNLMLDGGISAVWGIKQVRLDDLEDPAQVSGGIQQGQTVAVKNTLPYGMKVLETVSEGKVPQDAMAMFTFLNQEFAQAALTSELKMGQVPGRKVLATEIVEQGNAQAMTLDGIVADLETCIIEKILSKSWLTILQNADAIPEDVIPSLIDSRAALLIMRASPAQRFALFAGRTKFKCRGISTTMAKAKDFQKIMGAVQAVSVNPVLLAAFMKKFSADRTLDYIWRLLNLNPENLYKDEEEMTAEAQQQDMARTQQAAQLIGGPAGSGIPDGGGAPAAEVNQVVNPLTGMTPQSA